MTDELQARINNRETEYCRFGLEIHLHNCGESKQRTQKRGFRFWRRRRRRTPPPTVRYCIGTCACCNSCAVSEIRYHYN